MNQLSLLAVEAARTCKPALMELKHLEGARDDVVECALRMCDEVAARVDDWPPTRLHRWLGFVFGVLAARDVMTPSEQAVIMRQLLVAFPELPDADLADHRDPSSEFFLDLGDPG